MNAELSRMLSVLMVVVLGGTCLGAATPWPDEVVSFTQPPGSSNTGGLPSAVLGARDGVFCSIDTPEQLILAFTDNRVYDGPGDDIWIYEAGDCGAKVDVFARTAGGPCTHLGTLTNSGGFDLADYDNLPYLDFIRFVGIDDSGTFAGYELDAVQAMNSVPVGSDCIPAPGAILLGALGTGLVTWLRRQRCL